MDNSLFTKLKHKITYDKVIVFLYSLFEISYIYVLLRESSYKLLLLAFVVPIFMFNNAFCRFFKEKRFKYRKKYLNLIFGLVVFVLSIVLYTSINKDLYNMNWGAMSIPANVGAILLISQFVIFIILFINYNNISGSKNTKLYMFFIYMLPSLLVIGFLFIVYYPGNLSGDSIHIWEDVRNNNYADAHPIVYMMLIKLLSLVWDNIGVVSLFNAVITIFTFGYVCYQLDRLGVNRVLCMVSSVILPLFPANALYSVTAWKDIPYTMGLIILSVIILRCVATDFYSSKKSFWALFSVGLFTLFVRHNAIISVMFPLFFMGIYFIFKLDKKKIIKTLILGLTLTIVFFGSKQIIFKAIALNIENENKEKENIDEETSDSSSDIRGTSLLNIKFPTVIPLQQIIYTEHFKGNEFTQYEREMFEIIVIEEELIAHKEKYSENDIWMFYYKPDRIDSYDYPSEDFWEYYYYMFDKHPELMLEGYKKITSIVWCSSPNGSVAYRADSTININKTLGEEFKPLLGFKIRYILDGTVFKYIDSSLSSIFWRPALAFILSLIIMIAAYKKHGISTILFVLPMFFNQITYLLVTASQDTRYTYLNYSMFVIILALALTTKIVISDNKVSNEI